MSVVPSTKGAAGIAVQDPLNHPDRVPLKKGEYSVASRALALGTYFFSGALAINLSQFIGQPLYLINQDWYNAWIAFTKQSFGLLTMTLTQAFAPTKVIISGDASVRGQLLKSGDGNLILNFPSRIILIANHQIYTDWLYLWWIAYCNGMHGRLYIILKESLKKIPVLGWGMQLSQFIFLKRNWEKDRPHMASALQKLNKATEPMWLLLFPEGTNLAPSTREKSKAWAAKSGMTDMHHLLIPRTTGLQFCIEELKGTVDYLYDCTVAYEGVPRGQFAQDIFTLRAGYLEGRPPKSVSMYWRRFAIKDIPFNNQKAFELWLIARWREKDVLIEKYLRDGKFPADVGTTKMKSGEIKRGSGHLEVQIRSSHWYEFLQIFAPMGVLAMVLAVFYGAIPQSFWKMFNKQALQASAGDVRKAGIQAGSQAKAVSKTAAGLTLDDIFDRDKQDESFKKGAMAVQQFLQTPQAQNLMNKADFMTSFLQNPQKTVTDTVKGQRKDFMKAIQEEESRRKQLRLPTSAQNVGSQKGTFWRDLEKLDKSRHGSVITTASSKPAGTFWADLQAAERKKGGLEYGARGTFWDKMKAEESSRYGTVRTLSSDASTAVGSVQTLSSGNRSLRKIPSIASTLERRPSAQSTISVRSGAKPAKLPPTPQTPKTQPKTPASKQPITAPATKAGKPSSPTTNANGVKAAAKPMSASTKSTTPSKLPAKSPASISQSVSQPAKKLSAVSPSSKPKPVTNTNATKPAMARKPASRTAASTASTKPVAKAPAKPSTNSSNKQPPPKLNAASSGPPKLPAKSKSVKRSSNPIYLTPLTTSWLSVIVANFLEIEQLDEAINAILDPLKEEHKKKQKAERDEFFEKQRKERSIEHQKQRVQVESMKKTVARNKTPARGIRDDQSASVAVTAVKKVVPGAEDFTSTPYFKNKTAKRRQKKREIKANDSDCATKSSAISGAVSTPSAFHLFKTTANQATPDDDDDGYDANSVASSDSEHPDTQDLPSSPSPSPTLTPTAIFIPLPKAPLTEPQRKAASARALITALATNANETDPTIVSARHAEEARKQTAIQETRLAKQREISAFRDLQDARTAEQDKRLADITAEHAQAHKTKEPEKAKMKLDIQQNDDYDPDDNEIEEYYKDMQDDDGLSMRQVMARMRERREREEKERLEKRKRDLEKFRCW